MHGPRQVHLRPHQRLWGQRGRERPGKLGHAPHTGEPQGSGWAWGPQPAARTGPLSLHLRTRPAAPDVPARNGTGSATASTARSQGQSLSLPSKGLQSWWGGRRGRGKCTQSIVRGWGGGKRRTGVLPGNRGAGGAGKGAETSQKKAKGPESPAPASVCYARPSGVCGAGFGGKHFLPSVPGDATCCRGYVVDRGSGPELPPFFLGLRPAGVWPLRGDPPLPSACVTHSRPPPSVQMYLMGLLLPHIFIPFLSICPGLSTPPPPRHNVNNVHSVLQRDEV